MWIETIEGIICVRDGSRVWWPSGEAWVEIFYAPDSGARALRICRKQPDRGRWGTR